MAPVTSVRDRLTDALATQGRVIVALILREMRTRFGQSQIGYAWAMSEPMVHILALTLIATALQRRPAIGDSTEVFMFCGILPFLLVRNISTKTAVAVSSNGPLLTYPLVKPVDTFLARILLETLTMMVSAVLTGLIFLAIGIDVWPDDSLNYLIAFAVTMLLGAGIGVASAVVISVFSVWRTVLGWLFRVIYFTSGVFVVIDDLPPGVRDILALNPLAHCVAWFHTAQFEEYNSLILDKSYVILWGAGLLTFGFTAERALRRWTQDK